MLLSLDVELDKLRAPSPRPVNSAIRAESAVSEPDTSPMILPFWISSTRSDSSVIKSRLCSTRTILKFSR